MTNKNPRVILPYEVHHLAKAAAAQCKMTLQDWLEKLILKEVKK